MSKRRILTGLLMFAMCGTALAADPAFSEQEYKAIESAGIPRSDSMVTELTPQDQAQLKKIIKDKPAAEVKSFLVTRSFMRKVKGNMKALPKLDAAEEATIRKNFEINYCSDFNEQLDAFNALLYYGIEPARGTELKNNK